MSIDPAHPHVPRSGIRWAASPCTSCGEYHVPGSLCWTARKLRYVPNRGERPETLAAPVSAPPAGLSLPDDDAKRGEYPMAHGLLDYFPNALAEVSKVSKIGNDQHNPGEPMHWARDKSTDHENKILRHLVDRGKFDGRGVRHTARLAWRALAMLQAELEAEEGFPPSRASKNAPRQPQGTA